MILAAHAHTPASLLRRRVCTRTVLGYLKCVPCEIYKMRNECYYVKCEGGVRTTRTCQLEQVQFQIILFSWLLLATLSLNYEYVYIVTLTGVTQEA